MPNLVGIGLSQVPTNSMLGGMAYQDPEHASIKNLDLKNLSQINSEIADTAIGVFVYDTRKDSDGGAWRKRTQDRSWFNETLGRATRGTRREFPAVAVIVAETTKLTIYDGDDSNLPMWMVFNLLGAVGSESNMIPRGGSGSESDITSIACLNGRLAVGLKDVGGTVGEGLVVIDFISELSRIHRTTGSGYTGAIYNLLISGRNSNGKYSGDYNSLAIVAETCNDVAMTVLPNAPIDDATGLPVPTIAVATDGGTSVIKDDGTVVDFNDSLGSTRPVTTVAIRGNDIVHWNVNNGTLQQFFDALSATADSTDDAKYNYTAGGGHGTCENVSALLRDSNDGPYHIVTRDPKSIAAGAQSGMSIFVDGTDRTITTNNQSIFDSRVAYVTSDYNTGWMHGDIKGAFLSGISTASVTGSELVTNGTFDSDTSNWTANGSTLPTLGVDSNRLRLTHNGANGGAYQNITTVVGETYTVSAVLTNGNATHVRLRVYGDGLTGDGFQGTNYTGDNISSTSATTDEITFVAETTTTKIYIEIVGTNAEYAFADNVVARIADPDRSVNNKGLQVFGTVTKSAVATGADLVAYSGFSASNYLKQPYNSDLNFGTSNFCIMGWFKLAANNTQECMMMLENPTGEVDYLLVEQQTNGDIRMQVDVYNGANVAYHGAQTTNVWLHYCGIKSGDRCQLYINGSRDGELDNGFYFEQGANNSFDNASGELYIGRRTSGNYPFTGDLALWRISSSVPSPEQIKKIYEDEKHLFQENAQATLYGSSNTVTALEYDDDEELLYVGTSSGRSDFRGLRRINNTTTAVTTAISASNGLVAEQ